MQEIAQLIENYRPSSDAVQIVDNTKIALLVGISGAGKDTVKRELLKTGDYSEIVSHTTRPPRSNNGVQEVDGQDYHFIDINQSAAMLRDRQYIEAKLVHGSVVYGTSVYEVDKARMDNKIALTDVDVQGVAEYKNLSSSVVAIFLIPPSFSEWQTRLSRRYSNSDEFEAEWPKRRASAITELTEALKLPYYHFIINNDLERAVRVADQIAHQPDTFSREDDEARLAARDLLEAIKQS